MKIVQIVFLDEPSTGMDPVARRDMWNVISTMVTGDEYQHPSQKTSVILTTHSMEESEALCPRIGIMAGGKLRCLGSAQHLKSRFGKGFQVELKISEAKEEDDDFKETLSTLMRAKNGSSRADIESGLEIHSMLFNYDETVLALESLSGDNSLSSMVNGDDPNGYIIWKDAKSEVGVPLDKLAAFCVQEIRVKRVLLFFEGNHLNSILRERNYNR